MTFLRTAALPKALCSRSPTAPVSKLVAYRLCQGIVDLTMPWDRSLTRSVSEIDELGMLAAFLEQMAAAGLQVANQVSEFVTVHGGATVLSLALAVSCPTGTNLGQ